MSEYRQRLSIDDFVTGVRGGDVAILSRALTLIESTHPKHRGEADALLAQLMPFTGGAMRVGITGIPGAGKSTLIEALGMHLLESGHRLAVLAIDPSSDISGGSILGDKTRMRRLSTDHRAYIRPSPSSGTLGGVAHSTQAGLLVCEAAGFDVVFIETVGVGQSETMVADMTDCFVAVMLPGSGDELQGIKRGLLERVDIVLVNKADGVMKSAAELAASQYRNVMHGRSSPAGEPIVRTCSAMMNEGIAEAWTAIASRITTMRQNGALDQLRRSQNRRWMHRLVEDRLRQALHEDPIAQSLEHSLGADVETGKIPPGVAAERILQAFRRV